MLSFKGQSNHNWKCSKKSGLMNEWCTGQLLLTKAIWINTDFHSDRKWLCVQLRQHHISTQFCRREKNLRFQSLLAFSAEKRKGNRISIIPTCSHSNTFTCVHLLEFGVHDGLQNFHGALPGFCGLPSQTDPGNPPLKSFPGSHLWNGYNLHQISPHHIPQRDQASMNKGLYDVVIRLLFSWPSWWLTKTFPGPPVWLLHRVELDLRVQQ